MAKYLIALAIGLSIPARLLAQSQVPPVFVSGETTNEAMRLCQTSYEGAIATVESQLRHNNVTVASRDDHENFRAIWAYINLVVQESRPASEGGARQCIGFLSLSLRTVGTFTDPATERTHIGTIIFCSNGVLLDWSVAEFDARVRANLIRYTDECISEYPTTLVETTIVEAT